MTLTGHVHNNIIKIDDEEISLPEGSLVKIIPVNNSDEIDEFCGVWEDKRTAEEIIEDIKKTSTRNSGQALKLENVIKQTRGFHYKRRTAFRFYQSCLQ